MGRSKSHKKSKSHRERDRFVGLWRKGSRSLAKSKARGLKARGWRSVRGFVDRWVEGFGSKISSWREGSGSLAKSKACGLKALGGRLVRGFVDRWVEGSRSKIGSWVRRSANSKAWSGLWVCGVIWALSSPSLSLSLSLRVSPEIVLSANFDWN